MPTDKDAADGDYEAARDHDDAVREFVEAGEVQQAPHDAAPETQAEADETARDARPQGTQPPQGN